MKLTAKTKLDQAAFTIYLVTLILSPLLFGAVHTYAYTLMALGVLTGSLLLIVKNITKDPASGAYHLLSPRTEFNLIFLLLLGFLIFQVIPLPGFILEFLSPEAKLVEQKSLPASSVIFTGGPIKSWFTLSPYLHPVRMAAIRFIVYGLFLLGFTQVLHSRQRIELTISILLITACFEVLYGLAQTYSGYGHIWWYKKQNYLKDVTGTYINRNHFAGFMQMGLVLAACYSAGLSKRKKRRETASGHKAGLRVKISRLLAGEQGFSKRTLILFAGVVTGIGLVFSASRGGLIATAMSLLCMGLLFAYRKSHRRKGLILLFLFLIISAYALHIGAEYPIGRFNYFNHTFEDRSRYAQRTLNLFGDYPLTGIGVGNFRYAYPKYQASEDQEVFIRHAHNDWAQFLAEAGIIGICLLLVGGCRFFYRIIRMWTMRRDSFAVSLGVVPIAVILAVVIHSYCDFNLHIPANFLVFMAVAAIGYSALKLRTRHRKDKIERFHRWPLRSGGIFFCSWNWPLFSQQAI